MRALMYLGAALAVMGLAFWAYRENYRTQAQIDTMQDVQNEIARLRDDLGVLRAEWAYLNRPERLRELVDINFDRLRLGAVQSTQFGAAGNVDYPDPNRPDPDAAQAQAQGGAPADAGADGAAAGGAPVPPVPSNNRGAPLPRPAVRLTAPDADAALTADVPADAAVTETAPED